MTTPATTRPKRRKYFTMTVSTDVDVDIDEHELKEAGWHFEDDCPNRPHAGSLDAVELADAIASLHRQAHPSAHPEPWICHEEPCRSMPLAAVQRPLSSR